MTALELLGKLGLSPREVKVYLAALELGLSSAQEIGEKARIKRTTAYSVLEHLTKRGLVSKTQWRGRARFLAEPPQQLMTLISELYSGMTAILPELAALHNRSAVKPRIRFYEGQDAVQKVYDDTLEERPDEILEWNTNAYFRDFPEDHSYISRRTSLGIRARRIASSGSQWDTKHRVLDKKELAETAIVPCSEFNPEIEVNIYGAKLAFMNYADQMSIIIENRAIADAMKQVYELSWKGAKSRIRKRPARTEK